MGVLRDKFETRSQLSLRDLTGPECTRRTAASCFFEILQLNTWGLINAQQSEPYGDITVFPTEKLWVAA